MSQTVQKSSINEFLSCRKVEEFLMAYLEGELSLWSRLRFKFHLLICSDCSNYFEEYKNTLVLGKQLFDNPDETASGKVPEEILYAIISASKSS